MGDPFVALDSYADAVAGAVADAAIKATFVAGCVMLSVVCAAAIIRRIRRNRPPA